MIQLLGEIAVNHQTLEIAQSIRKENYRVNTPAKYQKHFGIDPFISNQLARIFGCTRDRLDYVYFSCKEGAEPHVDKLSLSKYEEDTIIVPLILPNGVSTLSVNDWNYELGYFLCYKFNHTYLHSLTLEDKESGCVLIMATVLK